MFDGKNLGEEVLSGTDDQRKTPEKAFEEKFGKEIDYNEYEIVWESSQNESYDYPIPTFRIIRKNIKDEELERKIEELSNNLKSATEEDMKLYNQLVKESERRKKIISGKNITTYPSEAKEDLQKADKSIENAQEKYDELLKQKEELEKQIKNHPTEDLSKKLEELLKNIKSAKEKLSREKRKKTVMLREYEEAKSIGYSYKYYREIEKKLGRGRLGKILDGMGLSDIAHKKNRTASERKIYEDARRKIIKEIIDYQEKSSLSINEIIDVLYNTDTKVVRKEEPKEVIASPEKLETIKKNASEIKKTTLEELWSQKEGEYTVSDKQAEFILSEQNVPQKRSIDEIKTELTQDLNKTEETKKLHAKNIRTTKKFEKIIKEQISKGKDVAASLINNIRLFIKGKKEASRELFTKLGMKFATENTRKMVEEIGRRIDTLSDEDKEILFDNYANIKEDNKYMQIFKMVVEEKRKEYIAEISRKNEQKKYHDEELQAMLNEETERKEQTEDYIRQKAA